jgi:hypothetical protein
LRAVLKAQSLKMMRKESRTSITSILKAIKLPLNLVVNNNNKKPINQMKTDK